MVNKMGILFKLWLLKLKGTIRNLFKHKLSGVFVIIMYNTDIQETKC